MIECIFTHAIISIFYIGFSAFMLIEFWNIAFNTKAEDQVIHKIFGIWLLLVAGLGVFGVGFVLYKTFNLYWCF